ncbi:MAG: methionine--tRNA ligase [Bdellovibrionales bacterium]|nr:methionine--tRNA ligase [Bdellovibrionales bacterium]
MSQNIYISTPLYYVNDKPHLGTAYTNIIADIFNRYQKLFGSSSFFITGTDEHGQKCEQTAKDLKIPVQQHCDQMSLTFENTWKALNIEYDLFFRTSFNYHKKSVQTVLQKLYAQGDIYCSKYEGWYCVSEEIFYKKKDLVEGKSPSGQPVTFLKEKAWFFKMSKYQKPLQEHLEINPQFIRPLERQNEIQAFLKKPLQDLCISRPKTRVSWGIEIPFDKDFVTYVWVDALLNYIVGAGYLNREEHFEKYWLNAKKIHFIGKDILITHAVYWSCLLMALKLPLPQTIFSHGWLLNKNLEKMSKSKGSKIDPLKLSKRIGEDELRWFLAKETNLSKDSSISISYMLKKINEQLADNLGNILSRVSNLIDKYFEGDIPSYKKEDSLTKNFQKEKLNLREEKEFLKTLTENQVLKMEGQIREFQLSQALQGVCFILSEINRYLEKKAPWKLIKEDKNQAALVLYNSLEALRICAILIYPVMPKKMLKLLSFLGETPDFKHVKWGRLPLGKKLRKTPILFPRIQKNGGDGRI